MNYGGKILHDMEALLLLFKPHCTDSGTLDELIALVQDDDNWHKAKGIFDKIRQKTLQAYKTESATAITQCLFEEICAKTLYNLSRSPAPFDPDSAYWVIPNALSFAKQIGVLEQDILSCVSKR